MSEIINKTAPHLEKLKAVLENEKLPASDRPRIKKALKKYLQWVRDLRNVKGSPQVVLSGMVRLLNEYMYFIDVDLIFDSPNDFLCRQKGQLKLDNSIIEEFLPWLINETLIPGLGKDIESGPMNCYSAIYFESTLSEKKAGAGIHVRTKNQDFTLSKKLHIRASHHSNFQDSAEVDTYISYIAVEIKTNLDKTMFQEACATARDIRMAVPGAKYFLMCEWLDMTPMSTATTDIEEVLILRKAKRLPSNVREAFSSRKGREQARKKYVDYLKANPFQPEIFKRFIDHVNALFNDEKPVEKSVLEKGYF